MPNRPARLPATAGVSGRDHPCSDYDRRLARPEGATMTKWADFSFYPVVRDGYRPGTEFDPDATTVGDANRARIDLELTATGPAGSTTERPGVDLTLYGPGEVTNVDADQVVRVEPEPETGAFPPNYFPLVEFDSPQLPWVFSPERADDAGRTRPWLCLVVVPVDAVTYSPSGTGPLPVLETPTDQLPPVEQSWAWAHAQVVGNHDPDSVFATDSTRTTSRLLCPRNLAPQTAYRACVVPTFEPGRRAGLGLDPYPDGRSTIDFAWGDADTVRLPVYHSWRFTSARTGDFESLVEEIDPVQFGETVGFRPLDASDPGPEALKLPADDRGRGTVALGGALKTVGAAPDRYDPAMETTLRDLLNEPSEVVAETDYGAVGPPLYGQYHAGVELLEPASMDLEDYYYPAWFNQLNSDPRNRIPAGYGTQVIRDEQERLMQSAWEQFGDIEEANGLLRRLQFAKSVLESRHRALDSYSTGTLVGMTAPLHGSLLDDDGSGKTVAGTVSGEAIPSGMASATFRRIARSTGPLARRPAVDLDPERLSLRLETGRIPRLTDGPATTAETVHPSAATGPIGGDAGDGTTGGPGSSDGSGPDAAVGPSAGVGTGVPSGPEATTGPNGTGGEDDGDGDDTRHRDGRSVLSALDGLDAHVETARSAASELRTAVDAEDTAAIRSLVEERPTVLDRCESVGRNTFDRLSRSLEKLLSEPRPPGLPESFDRETVSRHLQRLHAARRDLEDAIRAATNGLAADAPAGSVVDDVDRGTDALDRLAATSDALRAAVTTGSDTDLRLDPVGSRFGDTAPQLVQPDAVASPAVVTTPDADALRTSLITDLDPRLQLPAYGERITGIDSLLEREDPVDDVLAAPSFDEPTYKLLADLDQEYFLPGVGAVPRESVGVLQTNPEFIEAFMTGLNHEFASELQWRNYPTDRRGTYFRRFWERRGNPEADESNPEEMADIEPIHTWDENDLGDNQVHGDTASVVLLVRGELLRRYPNTTIFAAKAVPESGVPRDEANRVPALPGMPVSRDDAGPNLKFPRFRGTLDPDVTFFGFDLTPEAALYDPYHRDTKGGQTLVDPDDHADEGWFFVFQEPPGETRFGLDRPTDDEGTIPYGVESDATDTPRISDADDATRVAGGWSDLTWAHVSDDDPATVRYVDVTDSPPGRENWRVETGDAPIDRPDATDRFDDGDAAEWGYNGAHMARITWQLPVRVSIHADDMIPEEPPTDDPDWRSVDRSTFLPGGDG
ncbi:hypothetical protein BRD17_01765 [Halobacteriales archaeon SW_7_68_16]|nr:MAG: hypothetical protein BRD17_01765 [Halobacteriales archaeon SW_7_68_16]